MNKEQEEELIEILRKHYKHPEKMELNGPYLILFRDLKEFIKSVKC